MNIYKVERPEGEWGWEEFEAFVAVAETEAEARLTYPGEAADDQYRRADRWPVDPGTLRITLIGVAPPESKPGVVLASFRNG